MIDLFISQRMVSLGVCEHTVPSMHISQDPASWIIDTEAGGELGRIEYETYPLGTKDTIDRFIDWKSPLLSPWQAGQLDLHQSPCQRPCQGFFRSP